MDKLILAYIIGVAIGDGNLSNPNGRATRLRVTCDTDYPELIANIIKAIKTLLPNNKVSVKKCRKIYTRNKPYQKIIVYFYVPCYNNF